MFISDPNPNNWFLNSGFGINTDLKSREAGNPWDEGCVVKHLIDGEATMMAIDNEFEEARKQAEGNKDVHVFIAGWRLNPQRNLTETHTVWHMIREMMMYGVKVRILLWMPPLYDGFIPHVADHYYLAKLVKNLNEQIRGNDGNDVGVVFLDSRFPTANTAGIPVSSHHQKFIIVNYGNGIGAAFCGGVDLAYTRRGAQGFIGDSQSGESIPVRDTLYTGVSVPMPDEQQGSDLPVEVYRNTDQIWHDQHLKLQGPIVSTLEKIFQQRWEDYGGGTSLPDTPEDIDINIGSVISSSSNALQARTLETDPPYIIKPLENTGITISSIDPITTPTQNQGILCKVQAWQTIPWRKVRFNRGEPYPPYHEGEFTVLEGLDKAIRNAEKLIFIFDQYFWNLPFTASLVNRLKVTENLRIIIILPPFSDLGNTIPGVRQHAYRRDALSLFKDQNLLDRVGIYSLWSFPKKRGIYCHAKVQAFDQALLVCGSSNINWRSFTNDTELSCAALSNELVQSFYQKIWHYLFEEDIDINLINGEGWNIRFFNAFKDKIVPFSKFGSENVGSLMQDPWDCDNYELPNSPQTRESRDNNSIGPNLFSTIDPIALNIERYTKEDYEKRLFVHQGKMVYIDDLYYIASLIQSSKYRKDTRP